MEVVAGSMIPLAAAARVYGWMWEARRRVYAAGWRQPRSLSARVVSVGNLTSGGTGKTTLVLHLGRARLAATALAVRARRERGESHLRRYRKDDAGPSPGTRPAGGRSQRRGGLPRLPARPRRPRGREPVAPNGARTVARVQRSPQGGSR